MKVLLVSGLVDDLGVMLENNLPRIEVTLLSTPPAYDGYGYGGMG